MAAERTLEKLDQNHQNEQIKALEKFEQQREQSKLKGAKGFEDSWKQAIHKASRQEAQRVRSRELSKDFSKSR